jgi:1-acyl-sn-glycerol-3-phosphate acyltransferase
VLPFKKGGFVMALEAQRPVVPVAVSGGRLAMRKGSPVIRPTTITVELLPVVATTGLTFDDRQALVDRVRDAIVARLGAAGAAEPG